MKSIKQEKPQGTGLNEFLYEEGEQSEGVSGMRTRKYTGSDVNLQIKIMYKKFNTACLEIITYGVKNKFWRRRFREYSKPNFQIAIA